MKILTLVENTAVESAAPNQRAEHGLSMLVEHKGEYILFDTGQSDALIYNAHLFNVDLTKIKKVVLSHGHYDHAGGLKYLLKFTKPTVYAHPEIFRKRYSKSKGDLRYIGIEDESFFRNLGVELILNEKPIEVFDNIYTTGFVDLRNDFESVDKDFVYLENGEYKKDDVPDDLSLILDLKDSIFIVFGCAHRGIINIINHSSKLLNKKVSGFAGGTHLAPASSEQKEKTIEALREFNLKIMGVSHCTGIQMSCKLYCEFGNKVSFVNIGSKLQLD